MNYLYLNIPTQQPTQRTFAFNKRNERIDWRRIAAVDVDRIARELDFQVLQDNIEQIALCNIDIEVDSRAIDPNYIKLYKMAQLTIEYLLLCQDQITNQLVDYEQIKGRSIFDQDEARRQIEKLKNDLNTTKKESKKRKKMIETLQKMLTTQQSTHHNCPVCSHSFLSVDYLQAHIHRRHPEYDPDRRREHDVDVEKEVQRLRNDLQSKETELQLIKLQKAVDDEKIRERDENIRQLREDIQSLTSKITILEEKYFTLRSSTHNRTPSPHRREVGVKELLKENKTLRAENEQLKQTFQQLENNLKKEQKLKRHFERENQNLLSQIHDLTETLRALQNASGDTSRLSEELISYRNRYNEEKNRRKKLQDELDEANHQLAHFRNQPPPITDRKSPAPPPRATASPSPPPPPAPVPTQTRPVQTIEIFLPQYCPGLVRQINENPRYLNQFQNRTKNQFIDELEQYENLNVKEKDTRLPTDVFHTKMDIVEQTRRNMQNDLPDFERIRTDVSRTLDKLAHERISGQHATGTTDRSSGSKLVTFGNETPRQAIVPKKKPSTGITTVQPKSKYDNNRPSITHTSYKERADTSGSDDEKHPPAKKPTSIISHKHSRMNYASDEEKTNTNTSGSDEEKRPTPTRPGGIPEIRPIPRTQIPTIGVSTLVSGSMRPSTVNNNKTVAAIVRPSTTIQNYGFDSDSDSPGTSNVAAKTRVLDQKLNVISVTGRKPAVNAIAQGFQPSRTTLASESDSESEELVPPINPTTHHRPTLTNQPPGRDLTNTNQHFSSGDGSQYTYDSIFRSPVGKGIDSRRPPTADSAKTSNVDSDDNFDEDVSN